LLTEEASGIITATAAAERERGGVLALAGMADVEAALVMEL